MSRTEDVIRCWKEGLTPEETADKLDITHGNVRSIASRAKIKDWRSTFQKHKYERDRRIIEMYAQNIPVREIAEAVGLTYGSLKVTAARLGCTKHGKEWVDYRLGFSLPEELREDYENLRKLGGLTAFDAAMALGVKPLREIADAHSVTLLSEVAA